MTFDAAALDRYITGNYGEDQFAYDDDVVTCWCCGASPNYLTPEVPYCDDCNTDTCGHWTTEEALIDCGDISS